MGALTSTRRRRSLDVAIILAILLTSGVAYADAPAPGQAASAAAAGTLLLHYQGRLVDPATGIPKPDGPYQMVFAIYDVETGGTALWTEPRVVTVAGGLFSTPLGDLIALPSASFDGRDLWLGVKVGSDAEATPRLRIADVVYAIYARNADLLDGQHAAAFATSGHHHDAAYVNDNANEIGNQDVPDAALAPAKITGTAWTAANDGSGSGLDADLLDGQHAAAFATSGHHHDAAYVNDNANEIGNQDVPDAALAPAKITGTAWTAANDGSGSGLDADLLDGQHSTAFAAANHNHDALYYTQSQSDARFVNVTGDAMSASASTPVLSVANTSTGAASHGIESSTASTASGAAGVRGVAGLSGVTISGRHGVSGQSDTGKGVVGVSRDSYGTYGYSLNSSGVRGEGQWGGVSALSWGAGSDAVYGANTATTGSSWGVRGSSASPDGRGTMGATSSTTGWTYGAYGSSVSTDGGAGVRGEGAYVGVWGQSSGRWGVYGRSSGTTNSYGVYGSIDTGTGNYAGYFSGPVYVSGMLTKAGGGFKIDHPLDPQNKYLYHSFVESPDMMNLYNGNVVLNAEGQAWVTLPAWFGALNRDFRYQLTPIGGPGPNLYIAQKVQNNRFQIAGGAPGLEVSWQVTGIRQDPYAEMHRIPVEEDKPGDELGTYLDPEAYGQSKSLGLNDRVTSPRAAAPQPASQPEKP